MRRLLLICLLIPLPAYAGTFRCEHTIVLPTSCDAQVNRQTVSVVNPMQGIAEVSCVRYGKKTSWTQVLYSYAFGEPVHVTRATSGTDVYPQYMWVCPRRPRRQQ